MLWVVWDCSNFFNLLGIFRNSLTIPYILCSYKKFWTPMGWVSRYTLSPPKNFESFSSYGSQFLRGVPQTLSLSLPPRTYTLPPRAYSGEGFGGQTPSFWAMFFNLQGFLRQKSQPLPPNFLFHTKKTLPRKISWYTPAYLPTSKSVPLDMILTIS